MPRLEDLDSESQEFIRNFQCRSDGDPPWSPLGKPLSDCKLALITSSGLVRKGDEPFDLSNPGGDPTFRRIPADTDPAEITLSIVSANWDRSAFAQDINVIFPMDRVREFVGEGTIGALSNDHYAFMGSIFDIDPVVERSAPEVATALTAMGVDIALLVPV
jgi:D-proline reductase (dithiol) PrdB